MMGMGKRRTPLSLIEIAEELQIEIFLKLPVKSLLLCKCVCKHFRCVIQNPHFVRTHLATINRSDSQSLVLLHFGHGKNWHPFSQLNHYLLSVDVNNTKQVLSCLPLDPPIPIIHKSFRSFVVGSCNGLICVAIWYDNTYFNANASNPYFSLLLWNPVIRQCRYLPKHQSTCRPDVLEFGYVPEIDDYVIVKVGSPGFDIEVYKMSTDSWTTIHCNYFAGADSIPTVHRVQTPVFLNGSFHWATKRSQQRRTNETVTDYIVYYKVKDEEVGLMNVFDNYNAIFDIVVDDDERSYDDWKLSVIDERLAMIHWCGERGNLFEVWVMNDYGIDNSWTRRFQIADSLCSYVFPMGYWTNGLMLIDQTVCFKRAFGKSKVFFFYDVETRSLKKIPLEASTGYINGFSSFVETLVPVR